MDLDFAMRNRFGVVRTELLLRCGLTRADIRRRVAQGNLERLRHGWYAGLGALRGVTAAVRAGGVWSCLSALDLRDAWAPPTHHLHVRQSDHAKYRLSGIPAGKSLQRCGGTAGNLKPRHAVDPVLIAFSAALGCVSDEYLVAIIDSLLHRRRVDPDDVWVLLRTRPRRQQALMCHVNAKAESGTESLVRFRLARLGIKLRPQVWIGNIGRVDLLIGARLIIEVDSVEHHTDRAAYESDRYRDLLLTSLGYHVVRVTYRQVMFGWDEVVPSILALIRRREHLCRAGQLPWSRS